MGDLGQQPLVTVVMPVRQEAAFIHRSLGAVLAQDYPADRLEVILVDGQSSDNTREIAQSLQAAHPNLHIIANPGRTKSIALNLAIARAVGDVIIVVDGHCEIAPDYVRRCVAHLLHDGVEVVGGFIETIGESSRASTIAIAMSTSFGVGGAAFRVVRHKTMLQDTVPFPAYTRRVLQLAGPFDERLVNDQDAEYSCRLNRLGIKILMAADVHSRYYSRSSLRGLSRQYFLYGYEKVRLLQMHPRQMRLRHFAPPAFVLALLGTALLIPFTPLGLLGFLAVAGAYCAANLAASLWAAHRRGWQHLPLLPVAFAGMHLGYGIGFLAGLVKFWNRWDEKSLIPLARIQAKQPAARPQPSPDL